MRACHKEPTCNIRMFTAICKVDLARGHLDQTRRILIWEEGERRSGFSCFGPFARHSEEPPSFRPFGNMKSSALMHSNVPGHI